jgi:hypothetical protein
MKRRRRTKDTSTKQERAIRELVHVGFFKLQWILRHHPEDEMGFRVVLMEGIRAAGFTWKDTFDRETGILRAEVTRGDWKFLLESDTTL